MKRISLLIGILSVTSFMNLVFAFSCDETSIPKAIKKLENYSIIANHGTALIPTIQAFSGKELTYSFQAKPKNKKNKVTINSKTGELKVTPEHRDDFIVTVRVKNNCGSASNSFDIQIDEEE